MRVVPEVVFLCASAAIVTAQPVTVDSPSGHVRFALSAEQGSLSFTVSLRGNVAVERSPLGIVIDGKNLAEGAVLDAAERYTTDERYPWYGSHAEAVDKSNGARIPVTHAATGIKYTLEIRAYDDGVAFRHIVPGEGRRVPDEATSFHLPAGSVVWTHDADDHYESRFDRQGLVAVAPGEWALPPMTARLPKNTGYVCITEAALRNYSGMALQRDDKGGFAARLGHAVPASYPFRLRYAELVEPLKKPAAINGPITTPWRVVVASQDLNRLVASDIIHNLAPKPDPALFPDGIRTKWVKPGRAVWSYLDGGRGTPEGMREFSRLASELGFEYNVLEGFWSRWQEAELKSLADYSRERGVGILLWKHSRDLRTDNQIRDFFALCKRNGIAGAKIDFFDHEHKDVVDLYERILRAAAEQQLLVDFHGSNKPTGMERTWPNMVGLESIRGMESRPPYAMHNATLPFTRMVAGLADYTPVQFGRRMADTTWAHQAATAILFPAPLLVYGVHPATLLANPMADLLKSVPSVWDETVVLPASDIGEVAAFARRKGQTWFLAVANGVYTRTIKLDLSFLGDGAHQATWFRDGAEAASVKREDLTVRRSDSVFVQMPSGGGFVGRIAP